MLYSSIKRFILTNLSFVYGQIVNAPVPIVTQKSEEEETDGAAPRIQFLYIQVNIDLYMMS